MPRPTHLRPLPALTLALALAGCLPSSQRESDRSVSAADSASAALAETVAKDTLAVAWTAMAAEPMPLPGSLAWLGDALAVVEVQQGAVHRFSGAGAYLDRTEIGEGTYPYLAGVRGDTVVVLAKGPEALMWVVPGRGVARRLDAPGASAGFAEPGRLAVRVGGGPGNETSAEAAVLRLGEDGQRLGRHALPGPSWRALGFLRAWGDALVALSGYRPLVDLVPATGDAPADTLALRGFASPQLVRSAQFMRGEADEPPLLSSSAAALGDRLFVLNLRADHVRVDVYDRDGTLGRVLVSPGPWAPDPFVALDLAVRERGGAVEIAVLRAQPPGVLRESDARITLFRWAEGGVDRSAEPSARRPDPPPPPTSARR